jgi:ribose transport system substrate-binding protein
VRSDRTGHGVTGYTGLATGRAARRAVTAALAAAALGAALTACGSSSGSGGGTTGGSGSSGGTSAATSASGATTTSGSGSGATTTSSASSGVAHAAAVAARYERPVTHYRVPTVPIKGLAKLKGKTVMYIPLIQAIPAFAITASSMKSALAAAGIKTTVCNGGANPTTTAACLNQAVSQHVAGVVTDAIPYGLAANAFNAAAKAGVHVLITDQIPQPGTAKGDQINYQPGVVNQPGIVAEWMIADSKGHGNIVVGEEADSPSTIAYINLYLKPAFKKDCPSCTVKIIKMTASTPDQIASTVNTALLSNPSAQYYYMEFEDDLQGTLQGMQQANKTNTVKLTSATATIAGLQKLKAGQTMYADLGVDVNYEGWADADDIMRMMAGQPVVAEHIPARLFTRQNVTSLTLTPAAQASGVWYGNPDAFRAAFKKTWGVG